ncbi:hypothetical protein Pint_21108 [Pistacia integerrima]|uniref:Uncharacterized protein n=1 Tax=Pistacia integerrima TaxID=434235 RepID=A0ACC0XCK2_9ROSI|nr:hypothetical protein Pint_21108 [Pistacia integerrima]
MDLPRSLTGAFQTLQQQVTSMKEIQQGNQAHTQQDVIARKQNWELKIASNNSRSSRNRHHRQPRASGMQRSKAQDQNNLSRRPRK